MTASYVPVGGSAAVQYWLTPNLAASSRVARVKREDVNFRARGAGERGGEQSYGPRPPDEDRACLVRPVPPPRHAVALPPGSTSAPARSSTAAGEPVRTGRRDEHLVRQRTRPAHDPDLMAVGADVTVSRAATAALAAAQHGVAGDAGAVPGLIDPGADG